MQAATQATLVTLVEQHITSLVRECAVINRHSKRSGFVSAGDDDGTTSGSGVVNGGGGEVEVVQHPQRRSGGGGGGGNKRLLIHHDDVNLALSWRGSEKLYVSGVPLLVVPPQQQQQQGGVGASSSTVTDDDDETDANNGDGKRKRRKVNNSPLDHLLRATTTATTNTTTTATTTTTIPALLASSTVPRIDLNAYLQSELMVRPPSELGMTLHWLAVEGVMPMIPVNEIWNTTRSTTTRVGGGEDADITPALLFMDPYNDDDNGENNGNYDDENNSSTSDIRIRELQHRLLSEELQLYYSHVTTTISNPNLSSNDYETFTILSSIRSSNEEGGGIQELVPFLCRFVVSGLMSRRNLRNTEYCIKLVRIVDAMLDNTNLHLDLHLHQLFIPLGTCVVAKNLSNNNNTTNHSTTTTTTTKLPFEDHWSLRMEAAQCLVKACNIYGDQYTTIRPRLIKLFTQQALRKDRPLATQYGGIVGISLFGPRAIDAFILPLAREYWECWEEELRTLSAISSTTTSSTDIPDSHGDDNAATTPEVIQQRTKKRRIIAEGREYELHMCQRALLSAVQIFMQNVTNAEKSKRVDIRLLMDVFGERLIPMQPDITDYMAAVV